jgi:hypothetical protein
MFSQYNLAANFHQINPTFVIFLFLISRPASERSQTSTSVMFGYFSKNLRVCSIAVYSQQAYFIPSSVAHGRATRFFSTLM